MFALAALLALAAPGPARAQGGAQTPERITFGLDWVAQAEYGGYYQAVATGLPLMEPVIRPIPEMALRGLAPVTIPTAGLRGNLAGGKASGVLAQWSPPGSSDGHFVVFNVSKARAQAALFCRNLADDPVGLIPAP